MKIVKKYSEQFEKRIRLAMSPMSITEGGKTTNIPYDGDITLKNYIDKVKPTSGDQIIPYLVLKDYGTSISNKVAALLETMYQQEEAIKEQDFEKAANIRDDKRKIEKGLLALLGN